MNFQEEYSDYLEHHGVKGMRWGVRKNKYKNNIKKRKNIKSTDDISKLSDEELSRRVNRLSKEKQLRDLTKSDVNSGKKAMKKALGIIGTSILVPAATGAAIYALKNVGKGFVKSTADYVVTRKGVAMKPRTQFSTAAYKKAFSLEGLFNRMFK